MPPYSSGQEGTNHPFSANLDCHFMAMSFSVKTAEVVFAAEIRSSVSSFSKNAFTSS